MEIKSLLVCKSPGITLYYKNYGDNGPIIDPDNFSSFLMAVNEFSAFFIKDVPNNIAIGEYGVRMKRIDDSCNLVFAVLYDMGLSGLIVNDRLEKIIELFGNKYGLDTVKKWDGPVSDSELDAELDKLLELGIGAIIENPDSVKDIFESINYPEYNSGAFLSDTGYIYYSTLPDWILNTATKTIELRNKIDAGKPESETFKKVIGRAGDHLVVIRSIISEKTGKRMFAILHFDGDNIGMADFIAEETAAKLKEII